MAGGGVRSGGGGGDPVGMLGGLLIPLNMIAGVLLV